MPWHVSGSYFEACNCDAICPCRRQGGQKLTTGSTYGTCDFALSWRILKGHSDALDLAGFDVVLAGSYSDAEPGKPWRVAAYVDERANEAQQAALAAIFTGRVEGTSRSNFAKSIAEVYVVRPARIELDHRPRRWFFKAGDWVEVRYGRGIAQALPVTCGIPGHDQPGTEVVAGVMRVNEGPLAFEVHGRCAFVANFDYRSDDTATS